MLSLKNMVNIAVIGSLLTAALAGPALRNRSNGKTVELETRRATRIDADFAEAGDAVETVDFPAGAVAYLFDGDGGSDASEIARYAEEVRAGRAQMDSARIADEIDAAEITIYAGRTEAWKRGIKYAAYAGR